MDTHASADWLARRESPDHLARPAALLPPLMEWLPEGTLRIVDLGADCGANMRYLAPRIPERQHWTLVGRDGALMGSATPPARHIHVEHRHADLADHPETLGPTPDLITAARLLDIISRRWLDRLARNCRSAGCAVLVALSYDGRIRWQPDDPDDALVNELVNQYQRRDKGFGPALGPAGADTAASVFRELGFRTWLSPSPWRLAPADQPLQAELLEGWLAAARQQAPAQQRRLSDWARRRRAAIATARASLTVGHLDLLALPPETR